MASRSREFGPYRLIRRLGVGGMAETFEATRVGPGGFAQHVCLKRVLPAFSEDEQFVRQFRQEARLAAQLRHTNIVGVIDFGEVEDTHFMALELVDGVDLRSLLASYTDERLPAEWIVLIALDLAYALEHAHGPSGVVHRDISPSNVLVSRTGEVKLADFGIAKAMSNASATASQTLKGKIPYMSPEHMRGETIDGRADLFSLGVVLFEAAAGERPFDGAHDVETMQRILNGHRGVLRELAPHLPEPFCEVIERLLAVDREQRIASADELIDQLAEIVPSPQARRKLAARIEQDRGGPSTRTHVRAREDDERDTDLTSTPKALSSLPPPPDASNSRHVKDSSRRWLLVAGVIAGLVGLAALGTVLGSQQGDALPKAGDDPAAVTTNRTSARAVDPQATADDPVTPAAEKEVSPTTPPARARQSAFLDVVVEPWGFVWVDDKYMGRAPLRRVRLSKGRHTIAAGQDENKGPTQTRTMTLSSGRNRTEFTMAP